MVNTVNIPGMIRERRKKLGMTQREMSMFLGLGEIGERTIRGWESGEHYPTPKMLAGLESLGDYIPFRNKKGAGHTFSFIDLFAGIGGLRLPFQEKGGKCVFTSEWDKYAQKTYAANFGDFPAGDITAIPAIDIPAHDLLLAGFPCQAFSQAGLRKGFMDSRGTMFFEVQRILAHHRPKAFLLENVKLLGSHDEGRTLETIMKILRGEDFNGIPENVPMSDEARRSLSQRLNYACDFRVLSSRDFGVPQRRERIYIVGFDRSRFGNVDVSALFDGLHKFHKTRNLGEVLEKNGDVPGKYTISDRLLAGHERRRVEHKRKGNGFGYSLFTRESAYCNTISARYYKDGSEALICQKDIGKNPRKLTPRECARLQGFPEEYRVDAVSDVQMYKQLGNSVSVPVIRAIADAMVNVMARQEKTSGTLLDKAV